MSHCHMVLSLLVFPDSCDCLLIQNQLVPDLRLTATCPDLWLPLDLPFCLRSCLIDLLLLTWPVTRLLFLLQL
ncbi:unnamed protein product [Staurois parvus]|uniref:Uncharacterized protein n=1 Tax=Staurois parvus TaxID=386267 RepID=A0ABN9GQ18_9NEOB|nr:unnamed protein product [Staurois parvus]